MPDIPGIEPRYIRAGSTIEWTKTLSDFPATGYTLRYYLTGPTAVTLTATAYNITDHLVEISAEASAALDFGTYEWTAYAETGTGPTLKKYFIASGRLIVKTVDGKSFARLMLESIEAILEGRATSKNLDLVAKSLGSSSISKNPDLLMQWRTKFRNEYQQELAAEQMDQGRPSGGRVLMRFTRAR